LRKNSPDERVLSYTFTPHTTKTLSKPYLKIRKIAEDSVDLNKLKPCKEAIPDKILISWSLRTQVIPCNSPFEWTFHCF
jgi:hypothetical protein